MGTDSLYYIMDYSGNYYRTNQVDQLIAVAGEQDATVFTFAQANRRICIGNKLHLQWNSNLRIRKMERCI